MLLFLTAGFYPAGSYPNSIYVFYSSWFGIACHINTLHGKGERVLQTVYHNHEIFFYKIYCLLKLDLYCALQVETRPLPHKHYTRLSLENSKLHKTFAVKIKSLCVLGMDQIRLDAVEPSRLMSKYKVVRWEGGNVKFSFELVPK